MKITVQTGQTLMDIAIQVYGSLEGVFALAQENTLSMTESLTSGQVLTYDTERIVDKSIVGHYKTYDLHPATAHAKLRSGKIFDYTFDYTFN